VNLPTTDKLNEKLHTIDCILNMSSMLDYYVWLRLTCIQDSSKKQATIQFCYWKIFAIRMPRPF